MESIPRAPAKPCEYCRGAGEIETDNNGPIGPCPVCRPDAPGDKFEEHQRDAICKGELCPQCLGADIKRVGSAPDGLRMNAAYDCQNPNCLAKWEGY